MSSVEKVIEQSLLYDYYGELLTSHQQKIYEAAVFEDLSLGEIAEETGISRQGVYDLLKRCDAKLKQYEASLHLLEKRKRMEKLAEEIYEAAERLRDAAIHGNVPGQISDAAADGDDQRQSLDGTADGDDQRQSLDETADGNGLRQSLDCLQQLVHQLLEEI